MNKVNRFLGLLFFVLGIVLFVVTPYQTSAVSGTNVMGPTFFPRVVAVLMIVCSLGLSLQTAFAIKYGHQTEEKPEVDWRKERKVAVVFVLLVVYIFCLDALGFVVSSAAFGSLLLFILKARKWWYYAIYFVLVAATYSVFSRLLFINLP